MHLLYCDETNLEERAGDFLIYGGLMVDGASAKDFSIAMDELRTRHNVPPGYRLKFNPGPETFTHQQFVALKQEVLRLAVAFEAKLLSYIILHDIAVDPDTARRNGINTVCYHFDCILQRLRDCGVVLIDRFNDAGNIVDGHLRDKFTVGLTGMPYTAQMRLTNIVGFHYSSIGQSHFPSIIDILLGSLRFAINAHTRGQAANLASAHALLGLLSPLFWRANAAGPIPELGFIFSPKVVRAPVYREKYEAVKGFLAAGGCATEQEITDQRMY